MDEAELRVDIYRQAIDGGSVRVHVTHLPTGITAEVTVEGDQHVKQDVLVAQAVERAQTLLDKIKEHRPYAL